MAKPECPPENTLKEMLQGKVSEPLLSELTGHLEDCTGCQAKASTLAPLDTFAESLRGDAEAAQKIVDGIPRPLIDKVKYIARADAESDTIGLSQNATPSSSAANEMYPFGEHTLHGLVACRA